MAPEMDARIGDSGPLLRLVHDSFRLALVRGAGTGWFGWLPDIDFGEVENPCEGTASCPEAECRDENDECEDIERRWRDRQRSNMEGRKGEWDELVVLGVTFTSSGILHIPSINAATWPEKAKSRAVQPPLFLMVELPPFSMRSAIVWR